MYDPGESHVSCIMRFTCIAFVDNVKNYFDACSTEYMWQTNNTYTEYNCFKLAAKERTLIRYNRVYFCISLSVLRNINLFI